MRAQAPTAPAPAPAPNTPPPVHRQHGTHPAALVGAAVAGALIALAFGATSAAAQDAYVDPTVDEVTVAGPAVTRGDVTRLSRVVSVRDLDLTTISGQEVLRMRIRDTAREVCRELNRGPDFSTGAVQTCATQAIRNPRPQVRMATNYAYATRSAYAYLDRPYPYETYP